MSVSGRRVVALCSWRIAVGKDLVKQYGSSTLSDAAHLAAALSGAPSSDESPGNCHVSHPIRRFTFLLAHAGSFENTARPTLFTFACSDSMDVHTARP
jgi:hypothetical protein